MSLNFPPPPGSAGSSGIARSHSAVTISSTSTSSQEMFVPSPAGIPSHHIIFNRSESDLVRPGPTPIETTPQSRARSQSSPQKLDTSVALASATMQTPSSGRHVRPSPLSLQRQNSYHGSSPSPRRPLPPSRSNSSQGPFRRSRPGSLAASAFGITALDGDGHYSPIQSPTTSHSGSISGPSHSRQKSECLTPFTQSMATMALSPDISDGGDLIHSTSTSSVSSIPTQLNIPPLTPLTPLTPADTNSSAHSAGVFSTLAPDFGQYNDYHRHQQLQQQQQQHQHHLQRQSHDLGSHRSDNDQQDGSSAAGGYNPSPGPGTGLAMRSAPLQGYQSMPAKLYGRPGPVAYPGYSPTEEHGQGYGRQIDGGAAGPGQGYPGQGEQRWSQGS